VYQAWIVALVIIVVVHLRHADARHIVAMVALVALWLALPLLINGFTHARAGLTFEGRYSLPVFAGAALMPMWTDAARIGAMRRRLVAVAVALVVVAEVGGLWQMLRRFTVGANGKIVLTGALPWQPPVAPMVLIAVNAVAMIAVAWSAWVPWGQVEAASGERHGEGADHRPD
jgi:hypothetical protein